jgi:glycosyltransferase involved in cell wall biosynthesis
MSPGKVRVAHVIRVFSYGGAEVLLREFFASGLFRENVVSDLYVLDHKKLGLVPEVKPFIRKFRYYKITSLLFVFEYIKFLYHIIKNKYEVVHMHLPVAGWLTIVANPFCPNTTFIYSEHNLVTFYSKYNYYLSGLTYGFFDKVIFVSHEVGEVIKKVSKGWFFRTKSSVTILNGIDTDKYVAPDRVGDLVKQELVVGLVARFRPQKRVDRWVEVAAEIRKQTNKVFFIMVGDGPEDNMLREKIKENNLGDVIRLPGPLSDTLGAYKEIDIFLLTSDFEGLPLALLEAMSCGCVPVISNVGGIKQLSFKNFGHKFDSFNAKEIADVVKKYLYNTPMFKEESLRARNFVVENYSLQKQLMEIIQLYKESK